MKKIIYSFLILGFACSGAFAQSLKFDGSTNGFVNPDSAKFSFSGKTGYSFTMWAMGDWSQGNNYLFDASDAAGYGNNSGAFRYGIYNFGNNFSFTIFFGARRTQTTNCQVPISSIPLNKWFHVAATVERTSINGNRATFNLKLYIDGSEVQSSTMNINDAAGTTLKLASSSPMKFGMRHAPLGGAGGTTNLSGNLDDIAFFERTLTAAEVKDIICKDVIPATGRTLYYNCNSGTGNTVYDLSSTRMNGTLASGATWGTEHVNAVASATPTADFSYTTSSPSLMANLSDESSPAASWDWDLGDGNTSTQKNPSPTYAKQGTYKVGLTTTDVCGKTSTKKVKDVVIVCPPAKANFFHVSFDKKVDFEANAGIDLYSWDYGDGSPLDTGSTLKKTSHIYQKYGTYTVCLMVLSNCGTDTLCEDVTIEAVGLNENSTSSYWSLYPNPAKDNFSVVTPGEFGEFEMTIRDMQGRVFSQSVENGGNTISVQTNTMEAGFYIIEISNDDFYTTKKIIVK